MIITEWALISIETSDWYNLSGFASTFNPEKGFIIFIHWLAWSFYRTPFLVEYIEELRKNGYWVISFNNRWAHFITRLTNANGKKNYQWYSFEKFEDCIYDVESMVKEIKKISNGKKIILVGKSSWAQKALYSYLKSKLIREYIDKLVLISPCDDIGLLLKHLWNKEKYNSILKKMQLLQKEWKWKNIVISPEFFNKPISPDTYINHFEWDSAFNLFSYYNSKTEWSFLQNIKINLSVVFAEKDLVEDINYVENIFKTNVENIDFSVIKKSSHNYKWEWAELALITIWIKK